MNHYTAKQTEWARKIVARIRSKNLPADQGQRAADIALATALVESNLKMYANGNNPESMRIPHDAVGWDHGSVGLFQQQVGGAVNSTANWGTTKQLMDVNTSTDKFINALLGLRNPDWLSMSNGAAAQRVQGSAFPDRYAQRMAEAIALRRQIWGVSEEVNERDVQRMIANAFRAYHFGGSKGRWKVHRFGFIKEANRGVGDRLVALEKKAGIKSP